MGKEEFAVTEIEARRLDRASDDLGLILKIVPVMGRVAGAVGEDERALAVATGAAGALGVVGGVGRCVAEMDAGESPEIVEIVKHVVRVVSARLGHGDSCQLVVDATGVGKPVVDMLHPSGLGCWMTAVTITSGDKQHARSGEGSSMNVPKQNLMAGLQLALDQEELRIAKKMPSTGTLTRELLDVRMARREFGGNQYGAEGAGKHDDLVIALALAVWRAKTW